MNNEFIHYEEALALKELGFDEPCSAFYKLGDSQIYYDTILQSQNVHFRTNSELNFYQDLKEKISAPLYQQAFRWLQENSFDERYESRIQDYLDTRWFRTLYTPVHQDITLKKCIEIFKEDKKDE